MTEKHIVVEKAVIKYDGLVNIRNLFLTIDQWNRQHGYDRHEHKNYEYVTEGGKQIYIQIRPWKRISDYAKYEQKIEMLFTDIEDIQIERDGLQETIQRGKLKFTFQARLLTDYEGKWEGTPIYQFIRTFIDKFVHKTQMKDFEGECISDCTQLQDEIKSFLNLFRYKA